MEKLLKKLRAVEAALPPEFWLDENAVGVRIDEHGRELIVMVRNDSGRKTIESLLQTSESLGAVLAQEDLVLSVSIETPPKPQAIRAGTGGRGQGLGGWGTLGWFIYLDGTLVCVSNHHVLCADFDATPLGTPVYSISTVPNSRIGKLHYFDAIRTANPRLFDFALAAIDSPSLVVPEMAACEDGNRIDYPRRLGTSADLSAEKQYVTVGARYPTCGQGKFRGVATSRIGPYDDGQIYVFSEQLVFDPISASGDSGSIVVEKDTNRVVGLIFAGTENVRSWANPLYRKGWTYAGTRALGDAEIPMFDTTENSMNATNDFPDLGSSPLPEFFKAGRNLRGCMELREWLGGFGPLVHSTSVVQPLGNWMQVQVDYSEQGKIPQRRQARAWTFVPTGITYPE